MTVLIHSINFPIHQSIPTRHSQLLYETHLTQLANLPILEHISSIISISSLISISLTSPSHLHPHLPQISISSIPVPIPISSSISLLTSTSTLISIPQKNKLTKQSNLPATLPSTPKTSPPHHRHHPSTSSSPSSPRLNVIIVMIIIGTRQNFYLLPFIRKSEKRKAKSEKFVI